MRLTKQRYSNGGEPESKKPTTRSSSSLSIYPKSPIPKSSQQSSRKTIPSQYTCSMDESSEKNTANEYFTLDSSGVCKYCSAPKDYENKIVILLEDICFNLSNLASAYTTWNSTSTPKFNSTLSFRNFFSGESEVSRKVQEIHTLCSKINEIFMSLTEDVANLAQVSPWKNVSLRKPPGNALSVSVQEAIAQAQKHINWLKNSSSVDLHERSKEPLMRCLQLGLQQSFRERRLLETKVLTGNNSTSENVSKTIERVLQEHQLDIKNNM